MLFNCFVFLFIFFIFPFSHFIISLGIISCSLCRSSATILKYFYTPFETSYKHSTDITYLLYSVNHASEKVKPEQKRQTALSRFLTGCQTDVAGSFQLQPTRGSMANPSLFRSSHKRASRDLLQLHTLLKICPERPNSNLYLRTS